MFDNFLIVVFIPIEFHSRSQSFTCPMVYFDMGKCLESLMVEPFRKFSTASEQVNECIFFCAIILSYNHVFIQIIQLIRNNSIFSRFLIYKTIYDFYTRIEQQSFFQ